jgi:cell division protein FtsL
MMETKSLNEELIVRYLLDDLPEEEQARLEDLAFSDRELMQNILAVESDLIDDYARGELSDPERRRFERRFLASSERRQKVEFARALAKIIPETRTGEASQTATDVAPKSWFNSLIASLRSLNPVLTWSMATATVMLAIGVWWLTTETIRLRGQVAQLQAERQERRREEESLQRQLAGERARSQELDAQLERERELRGRSEELARRSKAREKPTGLATIAALFLPAGVPRSADDRPALLLPQEAQIARLQIGLERGDDYERYRAELRTREGREVWIQNNLRARAGRAGRFVELDLPASLLEPGEYELALKGVSDRKEVKDLGYYYFTALRK